MDLEVVAEGLEFPEGPIAMADGSVILVEIKRQTLTRVLPNGKTEVIAELGGGPNGAAIGPDGAVYVTNNGGFQWLHDEEAGVTAPFGTPDYYKSGLIQRVDLKSGKVSTVYDSCDGRPLRGPNDLMFDAHGGFWFTDLGKSDGDREHHGHLLYAKPDGSAITRVLEDRITPNGVGLSPNGRHIYIAETNTGRLWEYEIESPGKLVPPAGPWPALNGRVYRADGYYLFDSLAMEADGRVCVATIFKSGITIFNPGDGSIEHVPVPDPITTNICFGGPDMRTAWITGSAYGRLYKCRWPRPGLRLQYNG